MSDVTRNETLRRAVSGASDIETITRSVARAEGIPEPHIPAVVCRVRFASRAVGIVDGYTPLEGGLRVLVRRVVRGAVLDHERGVLERRCGS